MNMIKKINDEIAWLKSEQDDIRAGAGRYWDQDEWTMAALREIDAEIDILWASLERAKANLEKKDD